MLGWREAVLVELGRVVAVVGQLVHDAAALSRRVLRVAVDEDLVVLVFEHSGFEEI